MAFLKTLTPSPGASVGSGLVGGRADVGSDGRACDSGSSLLLAGRPLHRAQVTFPVAHLESRAAPGVWWVSWDHSALWPSHTGFQPVGCGISEGHGAGGRLHAGP